jgi:hypothetical protein
MTGLNNVLDQKGQQDLKLYLAELGKTWTVPQSFYEC